ncbi:MAG: dienelactone hydrolase family protein [Flavobacteriales bacterium]|nr:dienelactone hydrolase family protein [Flavobacteriales bacterium]
MKTLIVSRFIVLVLITHLPLWLMSQTCCQTSNSDFCMLASDHSFVAAHDEPVALSYEALGADITFPVEGEEDARAYIIRTARPSTNYLFVFHEWWGLNDYMRREADGLYSELGEVNVICIDLYDGEVATDRNHAAQLMQGANEDRIRAIIDAALYYVGPNAWVATIGWCFGGGWSLQATLMASKHAAGCVMYYGMPEKSVEKLSALQAPVLGIFASKDGWITPEITQEFEQNMLQLDKSLDLVVFDAEHAFANPSNPQYDKKATKEAHQIALDFLRAMLLD